MLAKILKSKPNISKQYIHQGSFSEVNAFHHQFQYLKGKTGS